jgi:probable metal-binding protein
MNTTQNIHGHEVLRLVHLAPAPFTRAELEAEIARRFGPDARFCTCSAADMTRDQLLTFLLSRGKIVEHNGRLATDLSRICNHPEGGPHNH